MQGVRVPAGVHGRRRGAQCLRRDLPAVQADRAVAVVHHRGQEQVGLDAFQGKQVEQSGTDAFGWARHGPLISQADWIN